MNEITSRQYSEDEVNRIIRRALKLEQGDAISHQDLIETARDIGIDPATLETAMMQEQREFKREKIRKARLKCRKTGFYSHLCSYIIVNAALLLINDFTPGPWWFKWSVVGWGIGVAFHFKAIFFSRGKMHKKRIKLKHEGVGFTV